MLAGLLVLGCLAGCSNVGNQVVNHVGNNSSTKGGPVEASKLEQVKLKLILPGDKPQHYEEAMKALNEKLTDRIHATLDIQYIPWDSYKDQILVKLAAGEKFDFFYQGWWIGYSQVLAKSGAKDITNLFQQYAPDLYDGLTEEYVNANKYKGKIYGVPVPGPLEYPKGYNFRADLAEKYGYKAEDFKTIEDTIEFGRKVMAADKTRVMGKFNGEYSGNYQSVAFLGKQREFIPSNDFNSPGILLNNEPVVINQFETQAYRDFLKLQNDVWNEGLVDKDSLFSKSNVVTDANSDVSVIGGMGNPPEGWLGDRTEALSRIEPGARIDFVLLEQGTKMVSSFKAGNFTVISPSSKNPERVLMFLNLLYTDQEVRDNYLYGIEGVDFVPVGDDQYEYLEGLDKTKVFFNEWWMVVPWKKARLSVYASETDKKMIEYLTNPDNFDKSVIAGFEFNTDTVKSEVSKVAAVVSEYRKVLESGSGTAAAQEEKYKEFIDKMKKAGSDKILAEKQKQIDEYLKK